MNLSKSTFYIHYDSISQAIKAVKNLNNFYISEISANLVVKLCRLDPRTDPEAQLKQTYNTVFSAIIPVVEDYEQRSRIEGISGYNFARIKELSNKEYFHGYIKIEF